jgi:ATP-dependent exoDNAse (exonuclease V) beta subunit
VLLDHQRVCRYRYHQAKLNLLFSEKDFNAERFQDLKAYLTLVEKPCAHEYFQASSRSSQAGINFSLERVIIQREQKQTTPPGSLVLQAADHNRLRHKALQQFMLANDSVTVVIEMPSFLTPQDIAHLTNKLGFEIPFKLTHILTGQIDILKLGNGPVYILGYKPNAGRE